MTFDDGDLLAALDRCDSAALDAVPFGVVKMRTDGTVIEYNAAEAAFSGRSSRRVMGLDFFVDVAPCTNNYLVAQRFYDDEVLDVTLDYVFTWKMAPSPVRLRLLRQPGAGHMYLVVTRRA